MRRQYKIPFYKGRYWFVIAVFVLVILLFLGRIIQLVWFEQDFLQNQGKARSIRVVKTPAFRGMILDRNENALAVSTPVNSVWVNPQDFHPSDDNIALLAGWLGLSPNTIIGRLAKYQHKQFMYLKRDVTPEIAKKIEAVVIPGVYLQQEFKRYYPEGEVASQVLGFTNIDDDGQEGLELAYNHWLSGTPGQVVVIKDLLGQLVAVLQKKQEAVAGKNLIVSIDKRIQFIAYQALKDAVTKFKAKSGSAVVLNVKTGEVLAMVNQPSFNPNDRSQGFTEGYRNRAVTDVFEPGSTMKAFSIMSALDSGEYTPETEIETSPGYMRVNRNWVRDELNNGTLSVTEVLQKSSNVGVTKMTLSLPGDQLWSVLNRVGFGQQTSSGFPGETTGILIHQDPWRPFALATLAFGYGVSVNTLQLANAYAIIANHGRKRSVSLVRLDPSSIPEAKQVIHADVADEMLAMLETVVAPGGTGSRARVPGYRVAGKTGTAKVAGPHGYFDHEYVGSFVGMAPVSDPEIVVAVVINQPEGKKYYGGLVAAPAFQTIMSHALNIMNIAPDDI